MRHLKPLFTLKRTGSLIVLLSIFLSGCGCSGCKEKTLQLSTIGGTVSGLVGTGLILGDYLDGQTLQINGNGNFTFPNPVPVGQIYNVSVAVQPTGPTQTCTVNDGVGTVPDSSVTRINVTCSTNSYSIGVTVTGLAGTGLKLQDNGGDILSITANGNFTFATPVASGANYDVTVLAQPTGPIQTCMIKNGVGTVINANIININVTCSNAYTISGTVTGLVGTGLVLQDNGGDNLSITGNGNFTFASLVVTGASYKVTVFTQPAGPIQICTVNNGVGTVSNANITAVSVICSANSYSIGGTVTGLAGTGLVLQDNDGDDLSVTANGTFAFATPVASGANYNVAVKVPPMIPYQRCTISNSTGNASNANVSNVAVNCITPTPLYAYVANSNCGGGTISQYMIGSDGSLTQMATPTVVSGAYPRSIAVDPAGKYVYVANSGSNNIWQYTIGSDGSLSPMTTAVAAGSYPSSITVDRSGKHVYVTNLGNNTVSQYNIGSDGSLALMSTPTVATDYWPNSITIDPTGKFAYVANSQSSWVSQYTINTDGSLIPMTVPKVAAGSGPRTINVEPSGRYAYVVNGYDANVWLYSIGKDGSLSPINTSAVWGYTNFIVIDPSGMYAYLPQGNYTISQFTIGTDGLLAPMTNPTVSSLCPNYMTIVSH